MAQSSFQGFLSPRPDKKGGGSNIKSIQRSTVTLVSVTSIDVTIASIDVTKSVVTISSGLAGGTQVDQDLVRAEILNSTTIRLYKGTAGGTVTVKVQVIEYNNVKSLQKGDITVTASTGTATISSVTTGKSILYFSWSASQSDATVAFTCVSGELTNSTTVTIESGNSNNDGVAHYQVIEFY